MAVKLGEYCTNVFALTLFNTLISEGFNPGFSKKLREVQVKILCLRYEPAVILKQLIAAPAEGLPFEDYLRSGNRQRSMRSVWKWNTGYPLF